MEEGSRRERLGEFWLRHRRLDSCDMRKTQPTIAGFDGGGGQPRAKGCEWQLEAGKGKEADSSLKPAEGMLPPDARILAQCDLFYISDLQDWK